MTNKERTELARLQKEYNELHERLGYSRNERTCRAINNRLDEICRKGKRSLTAFTAKAKPAKTDTADSALHRNIKG